MKPAPEIKAYMEQIHRDWSDHRAWCAECLNIRDKQGQVQPLELWPAQIKLHQAIQRQRKRGRPVRIVYLKARRVSVSVAAAAEMFHDVPFQDGQHGLIVAHDIASTKEIFDYCQQFEQSYRPFRGMIGLPAKVKDEERVLAWENHSYIRVATANNLKAGRASSLRFLQLDEFAFWRDARTVMAGLLHSVPDDPGTSVIVISTANGVGGPFYELWKTATDPANASEWLAVFFAWWEHPEYTRPLDVPADQFQRSLGKGQFGDELAEQAKYNLTLEQLNWRRWSIRNKCQGSVEIFRQECPGCPEEAFLSSGRPRFDHAALRRMAIQRLPMRGHLETETIGTRRQVVFIQDQEASIVVEGEQRGGPLAVYRRPEPNRRYVIGADTATGQDIRDGKAGVADPDFSVASVLDADSGEQVAKFRDRIEEPLFGEMLVALATYYNQAYLVPEANSYGRGVIAEILRRGYPTSLIYQTQREAFDRQSASLNKLGFMTTEVTRPQLISALDAAIREYSIAIRDANTFAECLTFIVTKTGRAEGQQDCHDDEVIALALAVVGLRTMPRLARSTHPTAPSVAGRYGSRRLPNSRRDDL